MTEKTKKDTLATPNYETTEQEFNLSKEAHIVDGIASNFTFQFRNEVEFEKIKDRLNERYYPEDKVKEFVRRLKEEAEKKLDLETGEDEAPIIIVNQIIDKLTGDKLK